MIIQSLIGIVVSLAILIWSCNFAIKNSIAIAKKFKIRDIFVGIFIIAIGTSLPEFAATFQALQLKSEGIVAGNLVGSNIANILLVIGIAATLKPIVINTKSIRFDTGIMLVASTALLPLIFIGLINFISGLILLCILIVYLQLRYRQDKHKPGNVQTTDYDPKLDYPPQQTFIAILFALMGLGALLVGAYIMIAGAIGLAKVLHISERVIALTIVAVGTSLPEIVTALIAIQHKHHDVIIGNVLGSNIFNILGVLGITALIKPIPINPHMALEGVIMMLGITMIFSVLLLRLKALHRYIGIIMLVSYCLYTYWLYVVN